jgi:hypothetical protein
MKPTRTALVLLATVLATLVAVPAMAAGTLAAMFSKRSTSFIVTGANGYAFDQSYFVLGLGASYALMDGFSVGLHAESWTGDDPGITKVTGSVQYVFYQVGQVAPYLGAFYRRTQIEDLDDLYSNGYRAGLVFAAGSNSYFGAGIVQENYIDCKESTYNECSATYPEFSFAVVF